MISAEAGADTLNNNSLITDSVQAITLDTADSTLALVDSLGESKDSTELTSAVSADKDSEKRYLQEFTDKLVTDDFLIIVILLLFGGTAVWLAHSIIGTMLERLAKRDHPPNFQADLQEFYNEARAYVKVVPWMMGLLLVFYLSYILVKETSSQGHAMEWLNLFVRWAHVVAGIMWIGASFYFIFLENNLNRTKGVRDELAGNLWAIHGGGFYFLEKYKVAPPKLPEDLHWFKYEAYFTWITGFALLCVVYYMDAQAYLLDPSKADISTFAGIVIGVGSLILGWLVYDGLCKSPIVKKPLLFGLVFILFMTGMAFFLSQIFNDRAAYIHIGAIIGTCMAWNVYFVIIPGQKALVKAAATGMPLDPSLGKKAGERSLHNNYLTLPVIFIMISNHFPSTFGHEYNWLLLLVISLGSAGIKHFWNLAEQGRRSGLILPFSVAALIGIVVVTSPAFEDSMDTAIPVSYWEAKSVIELRCVQCHSAGPTDDVYTSPPNGVMFDTPEQIVAMKDKIMTRAVRTKNMPQGNKTNMTDAERKILKRWILQGAKVEEL